jgi:endonuclease/exonuclease/phosphatase (EEP) superfamily protein YafD
VLLTIAAVAAVTAAAGTLLVRTRPLTNLPALIVAVGSPYIPLVALAGLLLSVLCRRTLLFLIAVAVLTATVSVQVQWYYFARPAHVGEHVVVRVLSSNLRKGQADAATFVRLAKAGADVITVSELTPLAVQRFSEAGIDRVFPYSMLRPEANASGIGLWSRFPLESVPSPTHRDIKMVATALKVPRVRINPVLASMHVISPVASDTDAFTDWRKGIATAKAGLIDFAEAAGAGAVIVGGDFNSTPDMRQFRDLLTNGYHDAVRQIGAGFSPTFPSNELFPPILTIDHVLTRNAAASSIRSVTIPGSDHRALLATIQVPLDPAA